MKPRSKWIPNWARLLKHRVEYYLFYRGTERFCPVCGKYSSKFLPMIWHTPGGDSRDNVKCPYCYSFERHRLIYLYLKKKTDFFNTRVSRSVIHVEPEPCLRPIFARQYGSSYRTADMSDPTADLKMDICHIEFPDNSFDVIFCSHVLEHVQDDQKAMREFSRTLKPGGWAIIMVPVNAEKTFEDGSITDKAERDRVFGPDHLRRYGPDFGDRLRANGFQVTCVSAKDFLVREEIDRMGLTDKDQIYYCTKAA
jgi:SAM-dependent methyltransferase